MRAIAFMLWGLFRLAFDLESQPDLEPPRSSKVLPVSFYSRLFAAPPYFCRLSPHGDRDPIPGRSSCWPYYPFALKSWRSCLSAWPCPIDFNYSLLHSQYDSDISNRSKRLPLSANLSRCKHSQVSWLPNWLIFECQCLILLLGWIC